ncbi:TolC family protein [Aeoliella mucimassa]|uniref:TolC family protein n=1 Tax=Aeoliella mucimassa TaxID=2527972 RepID=UPI001E5232A4|nr:TolC family protein [Aeoliella mucimassa]
MTEAEAVETALSNNSAFQATLAQLGMACGDSIQASLIANPQLLVYFPTSIKEGQYTLYAPIESYFLRPARVKAANREYRRVGEQLVQNGLDVARDARLAYIDLALADEQARLAQEAIDIRNQVVQLTNQRLNEGDISQLESITSRVDQLNAQAAHGVRQQDISIAEARLALLMGLPFQDEPLRATELPRPEFGEFDESALVSQALACRPDYHAARWAVAAASQRSDLSRWTFLRLDGMLDVRSNSGSSKTGGGLRIDLPVFNRNQGGIVRADWELNAAMHSRDAIRDQIVQDVRTAARQYIQARDNLVLLEQQVAPTIDEALSIAKKGYEDGGTDYLLVLQTASQYLDVRSRMLDQRAAMARAAAELERSVGCRLDGEPMDLVRLLEETSPPEELELPLSSPTAAEPSEMESGDLSPPATSFATLLD